MSASPEKSAELEALFAGLPIARVGTVTKEKKLVVKGGVDVELDALAKPFKGTLHGV